METIVYFVRHAESPFIKGMERTRGLSEKGISDAIKIKTELENEEIDVFVLSPYERAIQTIKELADVHKKDIIIFEDLKEREIGMLSNIMSFQEAKYILYKDRSYSFPDGESSIDAQERASKVMEHLLSEYVNKKIVIGTHGDIMTLMLNYFNDDHGFEFWKSTSMPDIYRLVFHGTELKTVSRIWRTA